MADWHSSPPSPGICDESSTESELLKHAPTPMSRKRLSEQLSMDEAPRHRAWERRRRRLRILEQERRENGDDKLTDDDLKELKGCIELGFGFNEQSGMRLCPTIPALDLYFAVNRQFWTSPVNSPSSSTSSPGGPYSSSGSPISDSDSNWKMFNPGDDPQQVKTRLRHWAQAVACSVMQSPLRGGEMDYPTSAADEKER